MSQETDNFIAKVDAFASGLNSQEQAMFQMLLSDPDAEHEVAGFAAEAKWPGLKIVSGPIPLAKLETDFGGFVVPGGGAVVVSGEGGTTI